ncbi:MAG: hypothetical protein KAI86_18505, partial [Desulfobacterales bacterium]|nr:hypothetical protein [Desulfobacterales bacterium]
RGVVYNTAYLSILSETINGLGIESASSEKKIVNINDKVFEVLDFMKIPGGMALDVKMTGFVPSKNETENGMSFLVPVLLLLSAGALSYPFVRKKILLKKRKVRPEESYNISDHPSDGNTGITISEIHTTGDVPGKAIEEMSFHELLAERNNLFESIMRLDNDFNSGNAGEQEYGERKKELRKNAVQVIKQLKDTATHLDLTQSVSALEEVIRHIDDIDVLEKLFEREDKYGNRSELKDIIEDRIEEIESNE